MVIRCQRHWFILYGAMTIGFLVLIGCARRHEEDPEGEDVPRAKGKKEAHSSLFVPPPAAKGKLTSDLDIPLEQRTFNESLLAETRKYEEREKKQTAQSPSSSAADSLPPGALDAPKSSSLPSPSSEELDRMSLSSFRKIPGDPEIPDVSIGSRSQPATPSSPREVIVPVVKIILRSLAEVNKLLGAPAEKSVGEQYGSRDVVCYYRVGADMEPVRVLFQDGKVAISVTVTFKQPVSREKALRRVAMASLMRKPQVKAHGNLVWDGGLAWKEGRLTLEAAEDQRDKFWSVLVEALTKTGRKPKVKLDESWGVGPP